MMRPVLIILLAVTLFFSCRKYVPGPQGEAGKSGSNGNSNVVISSEYPIAPSKWDSVLSPGHVEWQTKIVIPELDENALKFGDIKVYIMQDNLWFALPYIKNYIAIQMAANTGQIKLIHSHIHGGIPPRPQQTSYRVTIVAQKP